MDQTLVDPEDCLLIAETLLEGDELVPEGVSKEVLANIL